MKFQALKSAFAAGTIEKPDFIRTAYTEFHRGLFDYAEMLEKTDIKEIEITSAGVVFTIRSTGVKVRCQPGDHRSPPFETFNFSDFEPRESGMMHKLFERCRTFYDIGANIGWHSLNLAAKYRQARFYCFEPIPATYAHLQGNIRLNAFTHLDTFNLALSNVNSTQNYYFYEACSGNASAENVSGRTDVSTVACQQIRLDDWMANTQPIPPDFIKCDVEGAELFVFEGGLETLRAHRPIVMAEILRKWSAQYHYNPNQIFRLFADLGYQAFTTDGYRLNPFEVMTEDTVETNFFFLHQENHAAEIQRFSLA